MLGKRQDWSGGAIRRVYEGEDVVEIARLAGEITKA